jgi:V8-like Glu-specific endopeptidase
MTYAQRASTVLAAAVIVVFLSLSQATAWVFYVDQRLASHSTQVGRISFDMAEGQSTGTAFLVDECMVLTNFHVAFGPWYLTALKRPSPDAKGVFEIPSVTLANGDHPQAGATAVAWGDYSGPDRQYRKAGEDWVLLLLDQCLGARFGFYTLMDPAFGDDVTEEGSLAAIGFSSGRQMVDSRCSIRRADGPARSLLHDCAALQGDSGGPIILRGTNRVVAITSGFEAGSGLCAAGSGYLRGRWSINCTNMAVPLSLSTIERVEAAIQSVMVQKALLRLNVQAGRLGDIDSPELTSSIRSIQQKYGLPVTGKASCSLAKMLNIRANYI